MNRSIQVEGAFGVIKQDFAFRRFLTRGKTKTETQFFLLAFAFNIQKLWNRAKSDRFHKPLFEKKSHSVKKSKQSEKRGWKFYPPSELVRMPLKIFSTFFKISFLLKLNLSKNRDCCKFYSFATAPYFFALFKLILHYRICNFFAEW